MPLTPDEIDGRKLPRAWLHGYARDGVDRVLKEIADSLEDTLLERADLAKRVEETEAEATRHRELEALLRSTLVSAERAAQDMKEQAQREADLIVREAHAQGRRDRGEAAALGRRLEEDLRQIRALLRSALEGLADTSPETAGGEARDAAG